MAESEDKTETASQRRIEKGRDEGQVAVSRELSMLAGLAAGLGAIAMQFDPNALARWLSISLQHTDFSAPFAFHHAAIAIFQAVAPSGFAAAALYAAATVLQTEFLYRPAALQPDLSRISPLAGIKRLFSMQTVVSLLKSLAKLAVFVVCLWIAFGHLLPALPTAAYRQSSALSAAVLRQGAHLAMMLLGAQAVIAAADLLWERMSLAKKLRMTRQEQKDEHKDSEGNPQVKARLRQLARAMAKRRMMKAVPKAAVVLTNPTHYAVALNYERGSAGAPKVVAKGADEVAERIRELAREHRVPIIANPVLARALFRVEIDSEIPAEHFKAVAEIIAYVWRLRSRGGPPVSIFGKWAASLAQADIAEALFMDEQGGLAVLNRAGVVCRASAGLHSLLGASSGQDAFGALPEQPAKTLRNALQKGRAMAATARLDRAAVPRVLLLSLLPLPHGGGLLRVTDRTHEQAIEEQLGQSHRLQAVGELAGGIAHDFNNLLTAILGATDDILSRSAGDLDRGELDREDLAQIRASSERGAALVRQLLAFSRQQTLQPRVIGLNEAVRHTGKLLQRLLGQDVALQLELEEPGRMVRIDPTQLDQVLMNLAVNAGHAMPKGGQLTIGTSPHLVLRSENFGGEVVPPGRYACLQVRDTGGGISPELLPRIFEPFFTTKRETGGTGLGLSTVHGIVRQSGGYMAVESTPGGTVFRILLPRHEEAGLWQGSPTPAPILAPAEGRTVLLVDDEAPVRRLAERALRRQGFEVIAAASAEDALECLAEEKASASLACVISDVVMPGLDGPALVRRLRETWPALPAILMSGYADAALRDSLQAADICFLAKPFSMAELTQTACTLVPDAERASAVEPFN